MLTRRILAHVKGMLKRGKLMICKPNNGEEGPTCRFFGKYLLLTNIIASGFLKSLADIIQQEIEFQRDERTYRYDLSRTTRMFWVGLSMGPLQHYFYKYLDVYIPKRNLAAIRNKILLDQLIMSPISVAWFFYGMGWLEDKHWHEISSEVKEKFIVVYLIDWCLWPPTQVINFYFLPVKYQVLYVNVVAMVYFLFLSYIKHRDIPPEDK